MCFQKYLYFRNVSEPLSRRDPATNNVAEIKAVIRALQIAKECGISPVTIQPSIQLLFLIVFFLPGCGRVKIITDSMYLIDCMTSYIFKWLANDWRKSNGEDIKHRSQYRELLEAMEDMDIKWVGP